MRPALFFLLIAITWHVLTDNTWNTRFSAGNYDQGNTRGYVSVPGHGPIGYGF